MSTPIEDVIRFWVASKDSNLADNDLIEIGSRITHTTLLLPEKDRESLIQILQRVHQPTSPREIIVLDHHS